LHYRKDQSSFNFCRAFCVGLTSFEILLKMFNFLQEAFYLVRAVNSYYDFRASFIRWNRYTKDNTP